MENNNGCSLTLTPAMILTLVFLFLKVFDKVDWSYWIVFMPLWLPIAIGVGGYLLYIIVMLIVALYNYIRYKF